MFLKKAVITGCTGFLGYSLLLELLKNGYYIYALCRNNSNRLYRLNGLKNVSVIETDFNESLDIPDANNIDVFFHLAWGGGRNDFDSQYQNIELSVKCMNLAAKLGIPKFLCTGSQAEYGETSERITEETKICPKTSYGVVKAATHFLLEDIAKKNGIDLIWARVFSVYGPHDNSNSLIPSIIESNKQNKKFCLRSDGNHMWNYMYEEDAAKTLRLLSECQIAGVFNVADIKCQPLREYISEISSNIEYGSEQCKVNLNVSVDKLLHQIGKIPTREFSVGISEIYRFFN